MKTRSDDDLRISRIVGMNLKGLRAARGLSRQRLEEATATAGRRIASAAVCAIENGKNPSSRDGGAGGRSVSVDELVILAAVFGVHPEQLLTPPECEACLGVPPKGFACRTCGTGA